MAVEKYDVSKVKEKLKEIIGRKADEILSIAGVSCDIVGLKQVIRLKKYLSAIFSRAIADEILSLMKTVAAYEKVEFEKLFPKGSRVLTVDLPSINTLSPMLTDPLFLANILLSSKPVGLDRFVVEGLDLGVVFSSFKADLKGQFLLNIVSEDFEAKVLISGGKIVGACVKHGSEVILALKALKFLSEYVGEVEVVVYRVYEK